jgi:hypothetical protein
MTEVVPAKHVPRDALGLPIKPIFGVEILHFQKLSSVCRLPMPCNSVFIVDTAVALNLHASAVEPWNQRGRRSVIHAQVTAVCEGPAHHLVEGNQT